MKKRIILFTSIVIIFSLMIMTSLYFIISNNKYIESSRNILFQYNKILKVLLEDEENLENKLERLDKNSELRITYMDSEGKVLFDTHKDRESMENHSNREEFIEAQNSSIGSSVRYSSELGTNMIYYALKLDNGNTIRSSIPVRSVKSFASVNIIYYILAFIISILIAVILSMKITNIIIDPLKELEFITARIANGELHRRVTIQSVDELARLGKSFNHMADRLEDTLDQLLEKRNRLEAILKSMDSGVMAIDRNDKVIMFNPYVKKIFGIRGDIIGKSVNQYITEEDVLNALKCSEDRVEVNINSPEFRNLRIRKADIINGYEHIGTVAVVQDITDIKKLENMRSQFVANISHELKTPLTSIKGFAETLRYVDDEKMRVKFLDIIDEESDRLARLVKDILVLYEIEQNKDSVLQAFLVSDVLQDIKLLVTNEAKKKSIEIVIDMEDDTKLIADKDKFKQMILNLVYNGVKYTADSGRVEIYTYKKNEELIIEVKDNGIGISSEDLPRIFERFYRVDKARNRNSGGTGLGLAIVKHIVIALNGKIEVESELGKGTKFKVFIPIRQEL